MANVLTRVPAPGIQPPPSQRSNRVAWLVAGTAGAVAWLAWGVYRGSSLAGWLLVGIVYLGAIGLVHRGSSTVKGAPSARQAVAARRFVRLAYALGLVAGLAVCRIGTNLGVRWVAMAALAGLHAVVAVSLVTLVMQLDSKHWHQLDRSSTVVSAGILLGAGYGCYLVDRRPKCTPHTICSGALHDVFGLGSSVYYTLVVVACLGCVVATINYKHRNLKQAQVLSVSAVAAVGVFAAGTILIVATVSATAWWRNRIVVDGPRLDTLPAITGVTGTYVALGDSYAAGEGLGPFLRYTTSNAAELGNGCHRSDRAYSQLLRFAPAAPPVQFVACSGAVTTDLYGGLTFPRGGGTVTIAPQVDSTVHPEVGLVTLNIGGNDLGFSRVVTLCFIHSDCRQQTPLGTTPATPQKAGESRLAAWGHAAIDGLVTNLDSLYGSLRETFPRARIIVVGYPNLFPDNAASTWNLTDCETVLRRFSPAERHLIRTMQDELTQKMHDSAIGSEVEFVSPVAAWRGHEPCGRTGVQYTNSLKPFAVSATTGLSIGDGGSFHPNAGGQAALAKLVTCYLAANPDHAPADRVGNPALGTVGNPVPDCATK